MLARSKSSGQRVDFRYFPTNPRHALTTSRSPTILARLSQLWESLVANTKSAKKAIKVQERRRARNQIVKSKVKTSLRKANEVVAGEGQEDALAIVTKAMSELDKAVAKGVIHKNQAGRKKSRLMKKFNALA